MTAKGPRTVHPAGWPKPAGYSYGVVARGQLVAIAGQIGLGDEGDVATRSSSANDAAAFAGQFARALDRVVEVVKAAGGEGEDVVDLTIYVTSMVGYRGARPLLASAWKRHFPRTEPAVTLVEVKGLFDEGARVEIAGHAVLPDERAKG